MTGVLLRRRGSATAHATFTGMAGEITVDNTNWRAIVHDGVTPGGHPCALLSDLNPLGVNTTPDPTNKLAVRSNAALFTAIYAADGGNGDVQVKVNKETDSDTASFLFQKAFSGRAEIGNTGDNDFHFKVSPDGSTWYDALVLDSASGLVVLPIGQIQFPSTQNPSSDPNTLDDYEEGTWTPSLLFGGGATGMTYSTQNGIYRKIGGLCHATATITLTAKGSSTGSATISGLPFSSVFANTCSASIGHWFSMASLSGNPVGFISGMTSILSLRQISGSSTTNLSDANFTDTSSLSISVAYPVA